MLKKLSKISAAASFLLALASSAHAAPYIGSGVVLANPGQFVSCTATQFSGQARPVEFFLIDRSGHQVLRVKDTLPPDGVKDVVFVYPDTSPDFEYFTCQIDLKGFAKGKYRGTIFTRDINGIKLESSELR